MASALNPITPVSSPPPVTGSPEWHEERRKGIGGSEAASMHNEGYGCHRRLVMDKRGMPDDFVRPKREEEILERGTELEDIVAEKFCRETGLQVRRQRARVSKEFPHARVNMDRQIIGVTREQLLEVTHKIGMNCFDSFEGEPGPGALECKTMNEWDFKKLLKDGLGMHPDYIFQIQHTLGVTGYKWGCYAFLEPTWWQFIWFPVTRNESLIAGILRQTEKTWELVENTEAPLPDRLPDGDKRCRKCLKRRTCRGDEYLVAQAGMKDENPTEYVEDNSPELVQIALDWKKAAEEAGHAAEVEKAVENAFKEALGDREKVAIPEAGIKINFTSQPGSKRWDGDALSGEINRLEKMPPFQLQAVDAVIAQLRNDGFETLCDVLERAKEKDEGILKELPQEIATRLGNCKKTSKGSRPFKPYEL